MATATSDRQKALLILRVLAALVFVPSTSIFLAFILTTPGEHTFHVVSMLLVAVACLLIWFTAPQVARKLAPEAADQD